MIEGMPYIASGWGAFVMVVSTVAWAWSRGGLYTGKQVRTMLDAQIRESDIWREAYNTLRASTDLRDAAERQLIQQASRTMAQTFQSAQDRAEVPDVSTGEARP